MSEIWPFDVKNKLSGAPIESIRPFKCLLLMPFEKRFDDVANIIKEIVDHKLVNLHMDPPVINRLDWLTSSGIIQNEIWQEIIGADLIFCDITGYNPNVMFETGVCCAWKEINQVVLIKDQNVKQESVFDIAPIRYTEYDLTIEGVSKFAKKVSILTDNAIIPFPDKQGSSPSILLPFEKDFQDNHDDLRIVTPPFAHRRVVDGSLEFGSIYSFANSWASVGKEQFRNFSLKFSARFVNPLKSRSFIGVGLRSQHYYANFAHMIYLRNDGEIIITEPNEEPPDFYIDTELRQATPMDKDIYHHFKILFNESILSIQVDDFSHTLEVSSMKKVFPVGLIRFQSSTSWMAIRDIKINHQ